MTTARGTGQPVPRASPGESASRRPIGVQSKEKRPRPGSRRTTRRTTWGRSKAIDATEEFRRALDEVFGRTGGEAEDEAFRRTLEKELRLKELTEDAAGDIIDYPDKASAVLKLPDIEVGRSVGAKAQNYDIMDLKTGEHFQLVEGSHLQNVEVFAGKGTKSQYRKAEIYANDIGGKVEKWQHVKGIGEVNYYGESRKASIHWSQCEGYGKHDFFIKEWLE